MFFPVEAWGSKPFFRQPLLKHRANKLHDAGTDFDEIFCILEVHGTRRFHGEDAAASHVRITKFGLNVSIYEATLEPDLRSLILA